MASNSPLRDSTRERLRALRGKMQVRSGGLIRATKQGAANNGLPCCPVLMLTPRPEHWYNSLALGAPCLESARITKVEADWIIQGADDVVTEARDELLELLDL